MGAVKQIFERLDKLREARATLEIEKEDLAAAVTEVLTDAVSGSVESFVDSRSKELIDGVIANIDEDPVGVCMRIRELTEGIVTGCTSVSIVDNGSKPACWAYVDAEDSVI